MRVCVGIRVAPPPDPAAPGPDKERARGPDCVEVFEEVVDPDRFRSGLRDRDAPGGLKDRFRRKETLDRAAARAEVPGGRSMCVPAWLENAIRLFSSASPFSKDFVREIASGSVPG
ncbi:hypothetical protein [Methanoculleus chikugoensis]|uniref:hypothetical protein n=1 Tax=Methanoculleus chikugoensis TaxID=118126 RepID=UPI001FB3B1D4|nr:hypothetical protein [Methanoculleus chikugoensis]